MGNIASRLRRSSAGEPKEVSGPAMLRDLSCPPRGPQAPSKGNAAKSEESVGYCRSMALNRLASTVKKGDHLPVDRDK